jgi:MFS family permease
MFKAHVRICLAAFTVDFAVMVGITVLPFYVFNQLGGGAAMSGAFGAAQAACYAAVCLVSAAFVTRAKNALNWAAAGAALFALFSCLMPALKVPFLCGVMATAAMGSMALVWPALHAWVGAEHDLRVRARRMSWFNISWSFGFALSPLLAGPLYDYDYRLPFVILFALCAVVVALIRSLPHEKDHFGEPTAEVIETRAKHDRASEIHLYSAWFATMVGTVTRMVYPKRVDELVATGQLRILFEETPAAFLTTGPATKYSWLAFALGLTAAFSFLVMGRTRRWHHRFAFLFWLEVAVAIAFWFLATTRSLVIMMTCFAATGAFAGSSFFASVYYGMADRALKHRRAAINEGLIGVGGLIGSMVYGYLVERYGFELPFRCTPALIALALVIQAGLVRYGVRKRSNRTA